MADPTNPTPADPAGGATPSGNDPDRSTNNPGGDGANNGDGKNQPPATVPYSEFSATRKELSELKKWKEAAEAEKKSQEEEKLKKAGEYQKLAEQKEAELKQLRDQVTETKRQSSFISAAIKAGVVDANDAYKLADLSQVTIGDDGTITGIDEAIGKLKESKPYLFGNGSEPAIGAPSNPGNPGAGTPKTQDGKPIFTMAQTQDPKFYSEHKDEIPLAFAEGRVTQ